MTRSTPIHVVHVLNTLALGGLENRVARLARALHGDGYRVDFISLNNSPGQMIRLPSTSNIHRLDINTGITASTFTSLSRILRSIKPDIVHTHNWSTTLYGIVAARMARVPVIIHGEHGLNSRDPEDLSALPIRRRWAEMILSRLLTHVVCVNSVVAEEIVTGQWRLPGARCTVIPNGVDTDRFSPAPEAATGFTVGTVARLVAVKDLECLIGAFAHFKSTTEVPEARLVIIGEGEEREQLEAVARKTGLGSDIRFIGETDEPEGWYRKFSVYVNSSLYEGMSNTLLEAMSSGLPVVASDIRGNSSWLEPERNALLFKPGDPKALSACLERLHRDDQLRRTMSENNRALTGERFRNSGFVDSYRALYEKMHRTI